MGVDVTFSSHYYARYEQLALGSPSAFTFSQIRPVALSQAYSVVVQFGDQEQHSFKLYSYYKQVAWPQKLSQIPKTPKMLAFQKHKSTDKSYMWNLEQSAWASSQ